MTMMRTPRSTARSREPLRRSRESKESPAEAGPTPPPPTMRGAAGHRWPDAARFRRRLRQRGRQVRRRPQLVEAVAQSRLRTPARRSTQSGINSSGPGGCTWASSRSTPHLPHHRHLSSSTRPTTADPHRRASTKLSPPPCSAGGASSPAHQLAFCSFSLSVISDARRETRSISLVRTSSSWASSERSSGTSSVTSTGGSSGAGVPACHVDTAIGA